MTIVRAGDIKGGGTKNEEYYAGYEEDNVNPVVVPEAS